MDKKIELSIFGAVAVILFIVCISALAASDKKGPVIKFNSNEQLTFVEGQDDSILLNGVTAVDNKDGDVTNTLIIAGKIVLADKQSLKVTYAAKDKHNNVTKTDRIVAYVPSEDSNNIPNGEQNGEGNTDGQTDDTTGQASSDKPAETTTQEPTSGTNKNPVSTGPTGEIDKAAADASGIPVIKLKATEATITVGDNFNELNYVKETYDNSGDVSRRIRVVGDYDTKKPGDYQLEYLVSDTEGNVSEPAPFTLHVVPRTDNKQSDNKQSNNNGNQNEGNTDKGAENEENTSQNTEDGQDNGEPQNEE